MSVIRKYTTSSPPSPVTVGVGQVNAMGPEDIEKIKAKEVPFIDTVTSLIANFLKS